VIGERRHPAGDRDYEPTAAALSAVCRATGFDHQLRLGTLHALGEAGIAEERDSFCV
jgi:hypothetical protein